MINGLVDFALKNRFLILAFAILLLIQVITQWPGRAAEEVEQQVTVPLEIVVNGIPHLTSLRSIFHLRPLQPDAGVR